MYIYIYIYIYILVGSEHSFRVFEFSRKLFFLFSSFRGFRVFEEFSKLVFETSVSPCRYPHGIPVKVFSKGDEPGTAFSSHSFRAFSKPQFSRKFSNCFRENSFRVFEENSFRTCFRYYIPYVFEKTVFENF